MSTHRTTTELEAALEHIEGAPKAEGTLDMIVRRPVEDAREVLDEAEVHPDHGLVGDSWADRLSAQYVGTQAAIDRQITIMNSRFIALIAGSEDRWPLAGDQLYMDLDLSVDNLPPGTRLTVGEAVLEITEPPHSGCQKFSARFGLEALRFANSEVGRHLHLRGIHARVLVPGTIRRGDIVAKIPVGAVSA